jgi:hypothetical protein
MLDRGNTADPAATRRLLGYAPRPAGEFVEGERDRIVASTVWVVPLMRTAIAIVWLTAAAVSFGLYPLGSRACRWSSAPGLVAAPCAGGGVRGRSRGRGCSASRRCCSGNDRWLWIAPGRPSSWRTRSFLTVALPETWLHPFGPVVKNLPILVGILLCLRMARR